MTLVDELARHWWVIALRGLAAVVFGVLAFAWPGITLAVLVLLFGAYSLVDRILAIVVAVRGGTDHRLFMGLEGVVGVLAGLATFVFPGADSGFTQLECTRSEPNVKSRLPPRPCPVSQAT